MILNIWLRSHSAWEFFELPLDSQCLFFGTRERFWWERNCLGFSPPSSDPHQNAAPSCGWCESWRPQLPILTIHHPTSDVGIVLDNSPPVVPNNKNESRIVCVLCSHVLWTRIQNLTWWCNNPWGYDGNHYWGVEDHAPGEAHRMGRFDGAQSPQSRAASLQFSHGDGRCSDTGRNRAVRGWSTNNCHLQKKRSRSFNTTRWCRCRCTGIFSPESSLKLHKHFQKCLQRMPESSFSHYPWVGDSHWGMCIFWLRLFGKHHLGRVCDSHWGMCL